MRTDQEIFNAFDLGYPKFKWFIEEYFQPSTIKKIEAYRVDKDIRNLMRSLNNVWFSLPDDKFNVMTNPPGWDEFLNVITP